MQIKHTLYFDGENRTFEGKIVDDDGRKFESDDIDEFMAAVELFHDNGYTLTGIDMMPLEDDDDCDCDGCCGDCDSCDCENPDCTKCCEERDAEDEDEDDDVGLDGWGVTDLDDHPVVTGNVIHVHSLELLAMAAAGIGLWKLVKKLFRR